MNNFNNCVDKENINSQLKRADLEKNRLIRNIYKEYELYLQILRDLLFLSVEKGLDELSSYQSIKDNFLNSNEFYCLFEEKISKLIYKNLPLLTVEQLKINKIEKINKDINFHSSGSFTNRNDYQKQNFQYEDGVQFEETLHFQISEDITNSSEYYQTENHEKFVSLDLDKNDYSYLFKNNITENIGLEKQFISALIDLIEEVKFEKPIYLEKNNFNQKDILPKHQNLKIFNSIEKSLQKLLLNFSYNINQELFKANLIKKLISKDSFEYLVGKKLMMKHPHPFVINFELNMKQSLLDDDNFPSIIFFNISTVELEFINLNLSIQRNKINQLKNQFQHLIKKEKYWKQKEITLNRIR